MKWVKKIDGVQRRSRIAQKGHIIGAESMVHGYDIEIKVQSFQWKSQEEP